MRINNNVGALNAWRNLNSTDNALSKNLERLSSGYRINRAADDVAGLAISENMRAQIKGLNQAVKNAQDGISLVQTAEGSLNEVHTMFQRMRELSVQAANGTLQPADRAQIQTEMDNLAKEVTRITNATQFNSKDLINGSLTDADAAGKNGIEKVTLQIGPNADQTGTFSVGAMDAKSLGVSRDVLTGVADNGEPIFAGALPASVKAVTAYGSGLDLNKEYRISYTAVGTSYQLESSADGGTTWGAVGAAKAYAAGPLTVGIAGTNETISFTAPAAAPGANDVTNFTTNGIAIVGAIGDVGAGLDTGAYKVVYDSSTKRVQLKDALGTDIGADMDVSKLAGKAITLGDENQAKTIRITMNATLPTSGTATDNVYVGTAVGKLKLDINNIVNNAAGSVSNVGIGLKSGDYKVVALSATSVQLQEATTGNAIGSAVTIGASGSVKLGDAATYRTVDVNLNFGFLGGENATITINNLEQHAAAADFSGKTKRTDAQAFAGLYVSSVSGAQAAIKKIDDAIATVSAQRSQLGAVQNRLEHTINNLQVVSENLTASESRIRDLDMAQEMSQFSKNQILMQAGTAMLAQANSKNQAVLTLLRG